MFKSYSEGANAQKQISFKVCLCRLKNSYLGIAVIKKLFRRASSLWWNKSNLMFRNVCWDLKQISVDFLELLESESLISPLFFYGKSMRVEEFIIRDKSIHVCAMSLTILLISFLCLLIGLQSSVILPGLFLLFTMSLLSNDTKAKFTPSSRSI